MPHRASIQATCLAVALLAAGCTDYGVTPYVEEQYESVQAPLGAAEYGPAAWVASPNYTNASRSPAGGQVKVIVVHTVQGSYSSCINWFKNPSAKVSAHYVVSKTGAVTQMVKEEDIGWHVGSQNGYTIGIEHEGYVSDPYYVTPQMLDASAKLTCYLVKKWGLSPSKVAIKGHVELPNQTHTDPGKYWPWDSYIAKVNECVVGGPVCPPSCDDQNVCTDDSCSGGKCVHSHNNVVCWDGDACTAGEKCSGGACVGGSIVKDCNDGNPCTNDGCSKGECTHAANAAGCDDGNGCTTGDKCAGGQCQAGAVKSCDDGDPCTVGDACVDGACQPGVAKGCDDGNPCTEGDLCVGGSCQPGEAKGCDDGNPCTDDSCADGQCVHVANSAACDDGDGCTEGDVCAGGGCAGKGGKACLDGSPCTQDTCANGGCVFVPIEGACDDGDACSTGDYCAQGLCLGGALLDCDDGLACTEDKCQDGACQHTGTTTPSKACQGSDVVEIDACGTKKVVACTGGQTCVAGSCQVPGADAHAGGPDAQAGAKDGGTAETDVRLDGGLVDAELTDAPGLQSDAATTDAGAKALAPVTHASGCTTSPATTGGFAWFGLALLALGLVRARRRPAA